MGISIHYKGRLKHPALLPALIDEVEDIARIHKWQYHIFGRDIPVDLFHTEARNSEVYGICFSPEGSEMVCITFLSDGRMADPWVYEFYMNNAAEEEVPEDIHTKTHYAGVFTHKLVIRLLDHISTQYLSDFEMIDEAQYWETKDEAVCQNKFDELNGYMDQFADALENGVKEEGESVEDYIKRLVEQIRRK